MALSDIYLKSLAVAETKDSKLDFLGAIFTDNSIEDIEDAVARHSQGWNGDAGKGAQIIARILAQI